MTIQRIYGPVDISEHAMLRLHERVLPLLRGWVGWGKFTPEAAQLRAWAEGKLVGARAEFQASTDAWRVVGRVPTTSGVQALFILAQAHNPERWVVLTVRVLAASEAAPSKQAIKRRARQGKPAKRKWG